jgi:FKBP-type peptidyl-prolyl cis-trans isomerase (trigger factor)
MKVVVKKLPKSEVEIEGEIDTEIFETYFTKALKKIGENMELDGFRKGKVPQSVLVSKVPEITILEEMAQMALNEHYPKIITGGTENEKIDAIGRPEISITKLARKNPLGFKIKTAVLPEFTLPDYKDIAKKIISGITEAEKNIAVTDEDVENTIKDIRKSRAPKVHMAEGEKNEEIKEELPEFNDEFVKALGPFKDVQDFKVKLKENIKIEKDNQQKEKTRLKILEEILAKTVLEVPEILIEMELSKILQRMESDITQMGIKFEDYLKHLNKTLEDLRKEFRNDAEKKAKLALVLSEMAKIEKIEAPEEEVANEVAHILEHYKDADPERARMHAENVLTNEKIFQFLESQ